MRQFICAAVVVLSLGALNAEESEFECPNYKRAKYADPIQCDKYYECDEGKSTTQLCPDGLVFDESLRRLANQCTQVYNVECGDRTELQPPKGNDKCPRKNGYFAHPNEQVCHIFYNCIDGVATETICSPGLHFNELTGVCDWPDKALREGCAPVKKEKVDSDGEFECPLDDTKKLDKNGQTVDHPRFEHPTDCQKFFVCLNGVEKRALVCEDGQVFNINKGACDAPENVPECKDWYADEEEKNK